MTKRKSENDKKKTFPFFSEKTKMSLNYGSLYKKLDWTEEMHKKKSQ